LRLLESGTAKPHLKHVTELFSFLLDFTKLGDQEAEFLLTIQVDNSSRLYKARRSRGRVLTDYTGKEIILTLPMLGDQEAEFLLTIQVENYS